MGLTVHLTKTLKTTSETIPLAFALTLGGGERKGIMGASGSGKTTLLRMIAGLIRPDSGIIRWNQQIWYDENHWVVPNKRKVGLMFQHHALFPHLTVEENIRYGAAKGCDVQELLHMGELEKRRNHYPFQLSGGERQRVALLRTLAYKPEILLLDEPFNALDRGTKTRLLSWVQEIFEYWKVTLLMVSHENSELDSLCTEICSVEDLRALHKKWEKMAEGRNSKTYGAINTNGISPLPGTYVWELPSEKPERLYV
ncbi:MAG TPA: ATP-binding cassette domain-containing protein [Termitinemataceae bacterium]|nr:ATP-binding cassette domain-containing protein [Termitinemataceae bacterium]HOM22868.1 ATP-binding cassette domain-containing protein [Termitinemataceae bacterium]HPP99809.1 ATP-binding cassette domain-containing protein [Termitinemataceae bacterium]